MKKVKKISLFALTILMSSSITAFAKIPGETVVIGEKAYDLKYANDEGNFKEMVESVKSNGNIYIKLKNGKWFDNETQKMVTKDLVPSVSYKNAEGKTKVYESEDGEQIEFSVESACFTSEDEIEIHFSLPSDTETLKKLIKIDGEALKAEDDLSVSEDGRTVSVKLVNKLKKENFTKNIEIQKGASDKYGSQLVKEFKNEILVVNNPTKALDSNIKSDVNILCDNKTIKNLNIEGNLFVSGDKLTFDNIEVSEDLFLNAGKNSVLNLKKSKGNKIHIYSGKEITVDGGEFKVVNVESSSDIKIVSKNKAKIENLIVKTRKALVTLDGTFENVKADFNVHKIKLAPNAKIKKLVLKSNTSIEGDKTNKIGEIDCAKDEFKSDISQNIEKNVEIVETKDEESTTFTSGGGFIPSTAVSNKISKSYENKDLSLKVTGKKESSNKASLEFNINLKNNINSSEDFTMTICDSTGKIVYVGQAMVINNKLSFETVLKRGAHEIYLRLPGSDEKLKVNMSW